MAGVDGGAGQDETISRSGAMSRSEDWLDRSDLCRLAGGGEQEARGRRRGEGIERNVDVGITYWMKARAGWMETETWRQYGWLVMIWMDADGWMVGGRPGGEKQKQAGGISTVEVRCGRRDGEKVTRKDNGWCCPGGGCLLVISCAWIQEDSNQLEVPRQHCLEHASVSPRLDLPRGGKLDAG